MSDDALARERAAVRDETQAEMREKVEGMPEYDFDRLERMVVGDPDLLDRCAVLATLSRMEAP